MKSEYEELEVWALVGLILATGLLFLSACTKDPQVRPFTTIDLLLIGPSDVPQGWQITSESYDGRDHRAEGAIEASGVSFATGEHERSIAVHSVYRFHSGNRARDVFNKFFSNPIGSTPIDWEYESAMADQTSLGCYDYEGREPSVCEWAGRYEEYVVSFILWIIPDDVSLGDLEEIVRTIDARMTHYLNKTVPGN